MTLKAKVNYILVGLLLLLFAFGLGVNAQKRLQNVKGKSSFDSFETNKETLDRKAPAPAVPTGIPTGEQETGSLICPVKIVYIVDGDTMDGMISIWDDLIRSERIRLLGVDTPELRPRKGTAEEKAAEKQRAQEAKLFVKNFIANSYRVYFDFSGQRDSFGRVLGDLIGETLTKKRRRLSEELLKSGHGVRWSK